MAGLSIACAYRCLLEHRLLKSLCALHCTSASLDAANFDLQLMAMSGLSQGRAQVRLFHKAKLFGLSRAVLKWPFMQSAEA